MKYNLHEIAENCCQNKRLNENWQIYFTVLLSHNVNEVNCEINLSGREFAKLKTKLQLCHDFISR